MANNTGASGGAQLASEEKYITEDGIEKAEGEADYKYRGGSSSSEDGEYDPLPPGDRAELRRLATTLRSKSYLSQGQGSTNDTNADPEALERKDTLYGLELNDEVFDPNSQKFDLYKWIRMTIRLFDEEGFRLKRSGMVFKNVNVSGSGSAMNIQSNIGSTFLAPFRIGETLRGKKQPRQILRNFDGLVKSGELLIVLGRPGSGCSTLLKTLTGQMHGLNLDEGSTVHYNGIPQERMMKEFKGEVIYNQVNLYPRTIGQPNAVGSGVPETCLRHAIPTLVGSPGLHA